MFDPINPRQSFPDLERGILEYWKDENIFKRSIEGRNDAETFSFYDGPPFATGLPHYGHLLAGTIKDVIPRYQTMRGKRVERRFGWDCHGLPIEYEIEKEYEIKGKQQIEEMGVGKFNSLCRGIVQRYTKEWRATVERMGRWVDMDNDYKTMDASYMESIWWVFKNLYDKKLIYEGGKPMHICPRCATPLSNFEVTQGYKDRTDLSVIMSFKLKELKEEKEKKEEKEYNEIHLLAWTTTPWSLPGNLWLAVGKHIKYAKVRMENDSRTYILAEKLVPKVFAGKTYVILGNIDASELVERHYEPLFPYFIDTVIPSTVKSKKPVTYGERAYKVIMDDAVEVSEDEGTGIVHITSCLGEDSYHVAMHQKVDLLYHVLIDGTFIPAVTDFYGLHVKPEGEDPMATDKAVIAKLKEHGRAFSSFTITHSYPHCWRCDTPLLPYTTSSWFVKVEKIKKDMLTVNAETEWVPSHLRDGRFGKWLENARDWAISRNRYWGTPLPIWRSSNNKDIDVIMNRDDLMAHKLIRFTKVSVLRHGESEGNLIPIYQGNVPGTNLTDRGREQAKNAAEFLAGNSQFSILNSQLPTVIYSSPIARALQTAEAIAKETGAKIIIDDRLREINMGEHQGKVIPFHDLEVSKQLRKDKAEMQMPQSTYHLPGMETWDSVQKRMNSFFEETLPKHRSEHIVVVTHGDPIHNIKHFFTKEDPFKLVQIDHAPFATPLTFFWDHSRNAQMDLHKDVIDGITWPGSKTDQSVELTLVRHGETDLNKNDIIQGSEMDHPLNDTGHEQAKALASTLKKGQYDIILSSHLKRAVETAQYLAQALGIDHEEMWEIFRERDLGDWTGKSRADVTAANPPAYEKLNPAMSHHSPNKGESMQQFLDRTEEAASLILKKYPGKRVLLVAHGGFMQGFRTVVENRGYAEALSLHPKNTEKVELNLNPPMKRIPDVLDCWFESGSMPYAQNNFPFRAGNQPTSQQANKPIGFPADFIAEGIDQTRGWFYTLTVLSAALFKKPAFYNCVVNGTVLAEDGRKMSKRLKNYPDPNAVLERHGADALRFALMNSPAVRAEDLRFSEKFVEESVRSILLPLWNSYSFFVTYANDAKFEAVAKPRTSNHPLDRWMRAEVQDLVNRMTEQLDGYDLSATCSELFDTIDALTNWYIRLSRRRFAGKSSIDNADEYSEGNEVDRTDALTTLYDVLITISQLLAPFCPFVTESIYLNLSPEKHGSIHLTDWPAVRKLKKEEEALIRKNRVMRQIVSLGNSIRSDKKIKNRQPLSKATIGVPASMLKQKELTPEDLQLLKQELNVKEVSFTEDAGSLGQTIVMVDARKVGPRMGKKVQDVIAAGKRSEFTQNADGTILILDETLMPEEVKIVYLAREGEDVASAKGIVVSMDTKVSDDLVSEGYARDLIRAVQKLRKESGFSLGEKIILSVKGLEDVTKKHAEFIKQETCSTFGVSKENMNVIDIEDQKVTIHFHKS